MTLGVLCTCHGKSMLLRSRVCVLKTKKQLARQWKGKSHSRSIIFFNLERNHLSILVNFQICLNETIKKQDNSNKQVDLFYPMYSTHYSMSPTPESQSGYLVETLKHLATSSSAPTNKFLLFPTRSLPLSTLPVVHASVFPTYPTLRQLLFQLSGVHV